VRIEHRPVVAAKFGEQHRDVAHCVPADLAAGSRKFLDRLPEGLRRRADGAVLNVDDQQRRPLADAAGPAEAGRECLLLIFLADDAVPGFHARSFLGSVYADL
jgi:hypothetical protein